MKRVCTRCGEAKPLDLAHFAKSYVTKAGVVRLRRTCRKCESRMAVELDRRKRADPDTGRAYAAKRAATTRKYRHRHPGKVRRWKRTWQKNIEADEQRYADYLVALRMRRVVRNGGPKRGPTAARKGMPVVDAWYSPRGRRDEWLPAGPLTAYLLQQFPGWTTTEIAHAIHHAVSERLLSRLLREQATNVELDAADRLLTAGLGRPDLLNALYPYEGRLL